MVFRDNWSTPKISIILPIASSEYTALNISPVEFATSPISIFLSSFTIATITEF